jgi:hypothetical protein
MQRYPNRDKSNYKIITRRSFTMIKSIIKPEDWEELERVLRKHQIGYAISYDAHGKDHREMLIAMNPIGVQYYDDK